MGDDEKVDWSELPTELLQKIGTSLENKTDVLRFRSVCNSFRSSIPPSLPNTPSFPLQIPHRISYDTPMQTSTNLNMATVYRIEPTNGNSTSNLPLASKGWLIKVEEKSKTLPLSLISPLTDLKISHPLGSAMKQWNLLDHGITEVCKSYSVVQKGVRKVVFFPNSPWIGVENSVACCIFQEGKLGCMKYGDEKWTLVDDKNFFYDDVIVFKGQFYVTDRWGTISWVDVSSLKLIQFSPPLCGFGHQKHLVESCGSLYVVDRYYVSEARRRNIAIVRCFKVYKLDEEWGTWVDVKNLGDRVFILGNSCSFSVSAKALIGYQGNSIYFNDEFGICMFNLDDHRIRPLKDPCIDEILFLIFGECLLPIILKCIWYLYVHHR